MALTGFAAVDYTPAPYSHVLAWAPLLTVCGVLLFWVYHAVRWPRRLSIIGAVVNLGMVVLTLYILSDYFQLLRKAQTVPVEVVQKNARRASATARPRHGNEPAKDYWIGYRLPTGKVVREQVLVEDFDAIRVGDHVPLQWLPGDPSRSTLGDGTTVGVFSWIFALLVAALSAFAALGSGIGADAANERADRLAALMREEGLTCPHCGANRKDHTYHRRDRIAFEYFFVCKECQAKLKPADLRS